MLVVVVSAFLIRFRKKGALKMRQSSSENEKKGSWKWQWVYLIMRIRSPENEKRSIWEWVFLKMGKRSPENEAVQKFRKWRDTKWSGVGWAGALFHQPQNCQKYFPAHKFIFSAAFYIWTPAFSTTLSQYVLTRLPGSLPIYLQRRFKSKVMRNYVLIIQTSWDIFE